MRSRPHKGRRDGMSEEAMGHCYVMLPLTPAFERRVIKEAIDPAMKTVGLDRLGPRMSPMDGKGVFDEIGKQIGQAQICIADLTGNNPNVAAEVGIAIALAKPLVLITQDHYEKIPFDFKHLCVLQYKLTNLGALKNELTHVLERHAGSAATDRLLLRQMLAPGSLNEFAAAKAVVAASPLSYRDARRSKDGFSALRPTSADNVGIRGLLRGFGALFALNNLPELINPGDYRDEVLTAGPGFNLYTIGSPKANHWTGIALNGMNQRWKPTLRFIPDPESGDLRDVRVLVTRNGSTLPVFSPAADKSRSRQKWDFGLVLRAPNPYAPDCVVMILAGRSALGTHAACMVATEAVHLRILKAKLTEQRIDLDDHRAPFVAVVHMEAKAGDDLCVPDPTTLEIASVEPLVRNTVT